MKKNQGRKLPFFYHWKLSRKLLLLFLGVCVLPITVILGITMYRMVCSSIQMQLYTMDQNYDRVVQNFENIQERMERIASLIMVSDEVGDALRSNKQDSLVDELQRFDRLSDYTYQLEMSSDDISILYYIPDQFLISGSGNTCYRPESELTKWSVDAETMEQTAGDSWKVIQEKNRYGQRKSYLANFRVIWNTEQYTQRLGIVAVMIPVNTVKESMNNVMHMQSMYLLDGTQRFAAGGRYDTGFAGAAGCSGAGVRQNHPGNADLLWNHLCTYFCTASTGQPAVSWPGTPAGYDHGGCGSGNPGAH